MKILTKLIITTSFLALLTVGSSTAQVKRPDQQKNDLAAVQRRYRFDPSTPLLSRVSKTPDDVMAIFREAGMALTEHKMTPAEIRIFSAAIAVLPPLHQRVFKEHLKSISFVDNMPNTAITAPITRDGEPKLFHIAFRAEILYQTISEWVTGKEKTCYAKGDSSLSLSINAGMMSAITYVLLHEGTHVVDGSLGLLSTDTVAGRSVFNKFRTDFSRRIWADLRTQIWPFSDSLAVKSIFRPGGRRFAITEAELVYKSLSQTPFVSLYATASWHEDIAELLTIYHLTKMQSQTFAVILKKDGKEFYRFEPASSPAVQARFAQLNIFYQKTS